MRGDRKEGGTKMKSHASQEKRRKNVFISRDKISINNCLLIYQLGDHQWPSQYSFSETAYTKTPLELIDPWVGVST